MQSRLIIKKLQADGWYRVKGGKGDHENFKHPTKKGKITVPHPVKDVNIKTLISIEKASGVRFR